MAWAKRRVSPLLLVVSVCLSGASFGADSPEDVFWKSVRKSDVPDEYRLYLEQYPKGKFAGEAKRHLEKFTAKPAQKAGAADEPAIRSGSDATADDILWAAVRKNHRAEDYQSYLQAYPPTEGMDLEQASKVLEYSSQ